MRNRVITLLCAATLGLLIFNSKSDAATVGFEGATLGAQANGSVYTESGLQFQFFGDVSIVNGPSGKALSIGSVAEVLIARAGGGQFSFDSFLGLGGNFTVMYGYVGPTFVSGGDNNNYCAPSCTPLGPPGQVSMTLNMGAGGATTFPPTIDPLWATLTTIDWCGYCITSFGAGGGIDNVNFHSLVVGPPTGGVPVPAALPLFASGLGLLAWAARHRGRTRRAAA